MNDIVRTDWQLQELNALYDLPFMDLLMQAQQMHRRYFNPNQLQASTLISIKTGACPEDCDYCAQSTKYETGLTPEKKLTIETVLTAAREAKENGASRFCMGAAWRELHDRDLPYVTQMVSDVKAMGMETCMTLGMLKPAQAQALASAGLDYYNHNLDTSRAHYANVIRTRSYDDRLNTLEHVRAAGIKVCCGGILGLGEQRSDRIALLHQLATMPIHPESVPINMLVPIAGTPLENAPMVPVLEWIRTIAVARLVMPHSYVRLSAGRESLSDAEQALCFFAGANSIFYGEKLLTTINANISDDKSLLNVLGMHLAADVRSSAKMPCSLHSASPNNDTALL